MSEHTKLPWRLVGHNVESLGADQEGNTVCSHGRGGNLEWIAEGRANLAYIVRACNAYPALVEALESMLGHGYCAGPGASGQDYVSKFAIAKARAALELAKGSGK